MLVEFDPRLFIAFRPGLRIMIICENNQIFSQKLAWGTKEYPYNGTVTRMANLSLYPNHQCFGSEKVLKLFY